MSKRLHGILQIMERKHRLDQRVKVINTNTAKEMHSNYYSPKKFSVRLPIEMMRDFMKLFETNSKSGNITPQNPLPKSSMTSASSNSVKK